MELTHSFTVPAPIDQVWKTFLDLEEVGGCFPGATVTEVDDDSFSGSVKVKLGPIALVYNGSGRFTERDDLAHRASIEAKGKDKRGNGTAGANVSVQLTEDSGGTRADVVTDLSVTGKPAQFGRGVMQDVSDKLLAQFVACIEKKLTGQADTAVETGPPQESDTSTATPTATAAAPAPRPTSAPTSAPRHAAPEASEDNALDLGGAVLPVLARQAAPYLGGVLALALGGLLFRRLRRGKQSRWSCCSR